MVAAVMPLLLLRVQLGANCRQEEKEEEVEEEEEESIGVDVWASPGATGTHTLPLAFPGDRPTDLPTYLPEVRGERYPAAPPRARAKYNVCPLSTSFHRSLSRCACNLGAIAGPLPLSRKSRCIYMVNGVERNALAFIRVSIYLY